MRPASEAKAGAKGRDEDRLLVLLAEPGAHARRDEGIVQVVVSRKGVPLVRGRFPMAALAPLLSSGAVRCDQVAGLPRYQLTAEGRAAAFRRQSGEDAFGDQHRLLEQGAGRVANVRTYPYLRGDLGQAARGGLGGGGRLGGSEGRLSGGAEACLASLASPRGR